MFSLSFPISFLLSFFLFRSSFWLFHFFSPLSLSLSSSSCFLLHYRHLPTFPTIPSLPPSLVPPSFLLRLLVLLLFYLLPPTPPSEPAPHLPIPPRREGERVEKMGDGGKGVSVCLMPQPARQLWSTQWSERKDLYSPVGDRGALHPPLCTVWSVILVLLVRSWWG